MALEVDKASLHLEISWTQSKRSKLYLQPTEEQPIIMYIDVNVKERKSEGKRKIENDTKHSWAELN